MSSELSRGAATVCQPPALAGGIRTRSEQECRRHDSFRVYGAHVALWYTSPPAKAGGWQTVAATRLFYLICTLVLAPSAFAQTVSYTVAMAQPSSHIFRVEITIDRPGMPSVELSLPSWNGLYQIRDFGQYVQNLRANVPVKRTDKDTWRFNTGDTQQLKVSYGVYANEPGAFSSELTETHAFFNSADLLLFWDTRRELPVTLTIAPPEGWNVASSLRPGGSAFTYQADNYDHLVDCPVDAGKFDQYSFAVNGVPFQISVDGAQRDYDKTELLTMVEQIVRTEVGFFGDDIPFERFQFIYHFVNDDRGGGGMEHRDSTAIHTSIRGRSVRSVAGVTAHEFFHAWNVKRIRPQGLEPIDYSKENYTTALWFSEGVTSYYGDLLLRRAGLMTRQQYLNSLSDEIRTLQSRTGRKVLSAADASLLTWYDKYDFYREAERSISYYNKGLLIGLLLDLKIRDATDNKFSLDTVMRYLNDNFAKKKRFFEDDYGIAKAIVEATGVNLDREYASFVHSTDELPYADVLRVAGLEMNGDRVREISNPSPKQQRILESWLSGK